MEAWGGWFLFALFAAILVWEEVRHYPAALMPRGKALHCMFPATESMTDDYLRG